MSKKYAALQHKREQQGVIAAQKRSHQKHIDNKRK
jgi:hypothetical protein